MIEDFRRLSNRTPKHLGNLEPNMLPGPGRARPDRSMGAILLWSAFAAGVEHSVGVDMVGIERG
jgi:hypothetical protein